MANRETGKQRRSRIPLEYYKKRDPLARAKKWLAVTAALAAFGYWASGWLSGGDTGRLRYSRGDVAAVHATWDANCVACHEPATPVDRKNWIFGSWFARFVGEPHAMDTKCQACHSGEQHSSAEKNDETAGCAHCHREHRGRDAAIARVSDQECTVCHADLKSHRAGDGLLKGKSLTVTGFAEGQHPPFSFATSGTPAVDPGHLNFNHEVHMSPGLGTQKYIQSYLDDLADPRDQEEFKRRFGRGQPDELVKLECSSCHQLDPGDFSLEANPRAPDFARRLQARSLPTRPAGEYMMPITYENQCRLCHALTYPEGPVPLPHGLQPLELRQVLEGVFVKQFLQGDAKWLDEPKSARRMPGGSADDGKQTARKRITEQVAQTELSVFQSKCAECHAFSEEKLDQDSETPKSIVPTAVPTIWLSHSKFSHAAHRAVNCDACHGVDVGGGKYDLVATSKSNTDVLFTSIGVCQDCHAPPGRREGKPKGGARHDCAECHSYHNGDHPFAGMGAELRDRTRDRPVQDFLAGASGGGASTAPAKP